MKRVDMGVSFSFEQWQLRSCLAQPFAFLPSIYTHVSGNVEKAKEVASKSIENAKESTRKVVEEKAKEKIDEILSN